MVYSENSKDHHLQQLSIHEGADVFINFTEQEITLKNPTQSSVVQSQYNCYKGIDGLPNTYLLTKPGVGQYCKADFVKQTHMVSRVRILNRHAES